jgi:hypothetical protein
MNRTGAVLIALVVVACAARAPQQQAVEVQDDQFSTQATFIGTEQVDDPIRGSLKEWFIRSFVDKRSGEVTHQLYVHVRYAGERRRYETATDDHATPLPLTRIERRREDCSHGDCEFEEDFGLALGDAVLRNRAGTGFQVKVVAHSGDWIILTIAPGQILPQLAAVDAYRRAHSLMGANDPATAVPAAQGSNPSPGRVGVRFTTTPQSLAPTLKLGPGVGLMVVAVVPGSAADKAGIKAGDVILELDGKPTNAFQDFLGPLQAIPVGMAVRLVLWRANARVEAMVQL